MHRVNAFNTYHTYALLSGECDPSYPALRYVAEKLNLNTEQRYWLSFLYSTCYCGATAYYIFLKFPDFRADFDDISHFWNTEKGKLLFQTDRIHVKNKDVFLPMIKSWETLCGSSQVEFFERLGDYDNIYKTLYNRLFFYKRYSLFILLEALHRVAGLEITPTGIPWRTAQVSRNGLLNVLGWDTKIDKPLSKEEYRFLDAFAKNLIDGFNIKLPVKTDYWNLETTLCAFRKICKGTRYFGYYIDRQMEEIKTMQGNVKTDFGIFWKFRREYFSRKMLGELSGWDGIRKEKYSFFAKTGMICEYPISEVSCKGGKDNVL